MIEWLEQHRVAGTATLSIVFSSATTRRAVGRAAQCDATSLPRDALYLGSVDTHRAAGPC